MRMYKEEYLKNVILVVTLTALQIYDFRVNISQVMGYVAACFPTEFLSK
jgi:hypothetical protein